MNMIKIAALGLSAVLLALFLKEAHAPFSALVSLAACLLIVFYSVSRLSSIFELLDTLSGYVSAQKSYYKILLKIIGITYIADFSANLCRDAGYSAIAGQIEIFGKISILAVSSPIILALMETVYTFL
ncbi:MAG: stage III sporulation protein AD [Lachnospiraceae bacterium]|nr:stage III sporulation protein AD [Lachnospiraceae bacterium]MCD7766415.1 stage III sporulation protein AD [Lachnospiraceae bacterium]